MHTLFLHHPICPKSEMSFFYVKSTSGGRYENCHWWWDNKLRFFEIEM